MIGAAGAGYGAVPGAVIGGFIGLGNKGVQFIWPKAYENLKAKSYAGIDWLADNATKDWKSIRTTASNAISKGKEVGKQIVKEVDSVGKSIKTSINKVKKGESFTKNLWYTANKVIPKGKSVFR